MSKKGELKPKIYHVQVGDSQMLVRAKTRAGAIAWAVRHLAKAVLASQTVLVELTKAGVEAVDAVEHEADLCGERSANVPGSAAVAFLGHAA